MTPELPAPDLHPAQPLPPQLDDGFSPPAAAQPRGTAQPKPTQPVDQALWAKSEF